MPAIPDAILYLLGIIGGTAVVIGLILALAWSVRRLYRDLVGRVAAFGSTVRSRFVLPAQLGTAGLALATLGAVAVWFTFSAPDGTLAARLSRLAADIYAAGMALGLAAVLDLVLPYDTIEELCEKRNPAVALVLAAVLLGGLIGFSA